jgi:hypothetical protein
MNHLCDLPSLDNAININDEERDVLNAFRQRYESVLHLENNGTRGCGGASLPPCTDDKSNNTNGVSIAVGVVPKRGSCCNIQKHLIDHCHLHQHI